MRAVWFLALVALLAIAPLAGHAQWAGIWPSPGGGSPNPTVCVFGGLDLTATSVDLTYVNLTLC
jgi:hypothetical protein